MPLRFRSVLLALVVGSACAGEAPSVRLPQIFSDHAVLQQGRPLPVWGWAAPGGEVTVTLAGQTRTVSASAEGRWQTTFDALKAGDTPLELKASSGSAVATAKDLLVGEVWVCSGQSNMDFTTAGAVEAGKDIAAADLPRIRLIGIPRIAAPKPLQDVSASWIACSPASVGGFSAVGFFFGRELHRELNVPIGLIHTAVGGTPAEFWTSREALAANPDLAYYAKRADEAVEKKQAAQAAYEAALVDWRRRSTAATNENDAGWEKPGLDDQAWKEMALPQHWEKAGMQMDGIVWFRRSVELPAASAGKDLALSLGPIDDQDETWWDGEKVGGMGAWDAARNYTVPGRLATAGKHVLAIRVVDTGGLGGIWGKPEQLTATPVGGAAIQLAGAWRFRIAREVPIPPTAPGGNQPSGLWNGMVAPLVPFAIRGAIWYQGESNADRAWQYRTLFPTMIADWRASWGQPEMPFLFVQIANWQKAAEQPGPNDWAELRDAQLFTLRTVKNTGMAVTIDIGEANDIHPRNKQDVGRRLARWALADSYGRKLETSGPLFTGTKIEDGRIRVSFDHLGGGLVAKDGTLKQFAVAGEDRKFVWAEAAIDGDTVVVRSPDVPKPLAVRYAWAINPAGCNLVNKEGLPASPFRSDDWPLATVDRK